MFVDYYSEFLREATVIEMADPKKLGRTLDEVMAALPAERRERIESAVAEQLREIEGLKALRQIAKLSQAEMADTLGVKQPSVLKIERQTDLYLSTLRRFVEAAGGKLELRVELPGAGAFVLTGIGVAADIGGAVAGQP